MKEKSPVKDELYYIAKNYREGKATYSATFFAICTWLHKNRFSEEAHRRLGEADFGDMEKELEIHNDQGRIDKNTQSLTSNILVTKTKIDELISMIKCLQHNVNYRHP